MSTKEGRCSSQVQDQLNQLEKALQVNGEVLDTLGNKLVCVLHVPCPRDGENKRQELVPLASAICNLVWELRQQTDTMNYILNRLEL